MAQHGMKKKASLPKGVKQKSMKRAQKTVQTSKGPKKGIRAVIAPKKTAAVQQTKISSEVTKLINEKNEGLVRERADRDVGKTPTDSSTAKMK